MLFIIVLKKRYNKTSIATKGFIFSFGCKYSGNKCFNLFCLKVYKKLIY